MPYALTHRGYTGQAGLFAYIQDKETLKYWNDVGSTWLDVLTDDCKITLTESSEKGVYAGSAANLTPVKGGTYNISVFPAAPGNYLISTDEVVPPLTETLLQVVNGVQRALRFPASTILTDSLSLSIIQKINDIIRIIIPDQGKMENMKVMGSFVTAINQDRYRITPINCSGLTTLEYLRAPNGNFLNGPLNDKDFRGLKDEYNQQLYGNAPSTFRIISFSGGFPVVELYPFPSESVIISFEVTKKQGKLSLATEYVMCPDLVRLGATMLVKMDLGRDAKVEEGLFSKALSLYSSTETNFDSSEDAEV